MVISKKKLLGLAAILALALLVSPAAGSSGALTDIVPFDVPGATYTVGLGINNSGTISGYAFVGGDSFGFVTPDALNFTTFQVPGRIPMLSELTIRGRWPVIIFWRPAQNGFFLHRRGFY